MSVWAGEFDTFDLLGDLPTGMTVLEASAGTGKTYAIAALATRLVAEQGLDLQRLMMVTFSRMATAELRDRVRGHMTAAQAALASDIEPDDDLHRLLWRVSPDERARRRARLAEALATFDRATIATTHEFCGRMMDELGALADQPPAGRLMEDPDDLVAECVDDLYVARYADQERTELSLRRAHELGLAAVRRPDTTLVASDEHPTALEYLAFAQQVREEFTARKTARGLYTFDDLLTRLAEALADPQTGDLARQRLGERFDWVLIDEFQDTDTIQWRIVQRGFAHSNAHVVLIGDPKQAIYAFRGADVDSYLSAVEQTATRATLGHNWRSDARLVRALDHVMGGAALGDPRIVVREVIPRVEEARLHAPAPWDQPVRVRCLDGAPDTVSRLRPRVREDVVADISSLLQSGATLTMKGIERRVRPSDVAILVRKKSEGSALLAALSRAGVPAVFAGAESVYAQPAARDWLILLRALADPSADAQRQAALTSLMGWTLTDLATADDHRLSELSQRIRTWRAVFAEAGMAGLTEKVMRQHRVAQRLLAAEGGERVVTDLRHVAQILQAAESQQGLGLTGLAEWLSDRIEHQRSDEGDDRSRRLETDRNAVTIMTIHRSKGLQFPLVYLPDLADVYTSTRDDGRPLVVHERGRLILDVGGSRGPQRQERFDHCLQEEAADKLRQLYVAFTRAQCHVTCWWMPSKATTARSPLHRMLARDRVSGGDLARDYPLAVPPSFPDHAGVRIETVSPVADLREHYRPDEDARPDLLASAFTRSIDRTWRRTSYTGLTAAAHASAPMGLPHTVEQDGREDDESTLHPGEDALAVAPPSATSAWDHTPSPMEGLAGGTQFGSLVHAVLEHVDASGKDLVASLTDHCRHWLGRIPVPGITPEVLATALLPSLHTPLGPLAHHRTLAEIPLGDRLPELDFELPLHGDGRVRLHHIADAIEDHLPADDPLREYPQMLRAAGLGEQVLYGFLTGSIDVLMRVGDEPAHLVVDYKTNRIGPLGAPIMVGTYTHEAMAQAMMAAHYPLQSLLYGVATHRFLSRRQPGYDPRVHLGGVLYLFVRGMAGPDALDPTGRPYGVFDWKPPAELIVTLSELLEGR